jgi:hypothetical protein
MKEGAQVSSTVQQNFWLTRNLSTNFDVWPTKIVSGAYSHGFCDRFLRTKSTRKAFDSVGAATRICDLICRKATR